MRSSAGLERAAEVRRLRDEEGLMFREIADRLGVAKTTAADYYYDPTGEMADARKRCYERACTGCGKTINPNGIKREATRCVKCNGEHSREMTRQWVLDSMHEWAETFGAPPSSIDWNPALARNHTKGYCAWKADRYEATGRPWPSPSTVIDHFGTWNAGLEAAGFTPLKPSELWMGHAGVAARNADLEEAA